MPKVGHSMLREGKCAPFCSTTLRFRDICDFVKFYRWKCHKSGKKEHFANLAVKTLKDKKRNLAADRGHPGVPAQKIWDQSDKR